MVLFQIFFLRTKAKQVNYNIVFVELMRETGEKAVIAVPGSLWWRWARLAGTLGETCHRIPGG